MIELLNVDCMEYMKTVPDKFFDLAIVDVPYGIKISSRKTLGSPAPFGGKKGGRSKAHQSIAPTVFKPKDWDNSAPDYDYFEELFRVSKNQIVWGANHFISKIPLDSPCWIIWDKETTADYADAELAWTSFKTAVRKYTFKWSGCLQGDMKNKEVRQHPTQKPVKLYKWLLHNYAKPGDKILDTHGGSMSIAIACHQMGFDLTLCEIDKDYYDAGVKRFREQTLQGDLFK